MKTRNIICTVLLLGAILISDYSWAQISAFASMQINRKKVYPQEPIKASVKVHTATWFSSPLQFDNLQIPNAFVIPFKRTVSSMVTINRKKYATLEFYYLIYPYQSGEFTIPEISIDAETPPEGSAKSQAITIKTKEVKFTVKEIPENYDGVWFVAKNVSLTEKWNKPLDQLKVGDVIERTISTRANGTLPSFIPDFELEKPDWASVYPKAATLTDLRNDKDVNGLKEQKVLYLLEKEGEFKVPRIKTQWWNPYHNKAYFKETKQLTFKVAPNDDLGMLESVRDSLATDEGTIEVAEEDKEFLILGMKPWQFVLLLVVAIFVLRTIFIWLKKMYLKAKQKRADYLDSEKYYFDQMKKRKQPWMQYIYEWWDRYKRKPSPSVEESVPFDQESEKAWTNMMASKYSSKKSPYDEKVLIESFEKYRKRKKKKGGKSSSHQFSFEE